MKMNENTSGQFITIFKRMNNLQIYTYTNAIKENYKPHILVSTNVYRNNAQKYATSQPHGHQSASTWFSTEIRSHVFKSI